MQYVILMGFYAYLRFYATRKLYAYYFTLQGGWGLPGQLEQVVETEDRETEGENENGVRKW